MVLAYIPAYVGQVPIFMRQYRIFVAAFLETCPSGGTVLIFHILQNSMNPFWLENILIILLILNNLQVPIFHNNPAVPNSSTNHHSTNRFMIIY